LQWCRALQRALGAEAACPCHHLTVLQAVDTSAEAAWWEPLSKSPLLLTLPVCEGRRMQRGVCQKSSDGKEPFHIVGFPSRLKWWVR